ncbi:MAG TPA: histidinol-phosphate transaminase [Bacteroidetes bacterium]|nr:histidinol-phosphate transaminase [Bacteroidota bacterium]
MNSTEFDLDSLVRPNIKVLTPYRCARDDYDQGILLDANENAIGSVPADTRALNRYPDPHQDELRTQYAAFRNVKMEQVFCGVGSDEAIDLLIRIFCVPGRDEIMITPPTYGMYKVSASINDVFVRAVPLEPDFSLNVDAVVDAISPQTRIIFLCSPNNPTGNLLNKDAIRQILQHFRGIVVVDEAYVDFSGDEGFAGQLDEFPNLVILQTLSKSFGLAGIRLGIALASEQIIGYMLRVKAPYNVNKLTSEAAIQAMRQIPVMQAFVKALNNEKKWLISQLETIPAVKKIHPSDSNFLLIVIDNAYEVYKNMADTGIVVRFRGDQIHCDSALRITVGTHKENELLIAKLKEITS